VRGSGSVGLRHLLQYRESRHLITGPGEMQGAAKKAPLQIVQSHGVSLAACCVVVS